MKLDVSKAFVRPMEDFAFEIEVPLEAQEINGDTVTFDPVVITGTYRMADNVVHVKGSLRTLAHAPCALCLAPVSTEVAVDFSEEFRKDADEEEDGCFRYEDKLLPMDHMTLTLVLLNMPMRFHCDTDCTGGAGLTAWNEQETVWAETPEDAQSTYRPFEGLKAMLEEQQNDTH